MGKGQTAANVCVPGYLEVLFPPFSGCDPFLLEPVYIYIYIYPLSMSLDCQGSPLVDVFWAARFTVLGFRVQASSGLRCALLSILGLPSYHVDLAPEKLGRWAFAVQTCKLLGACLHLGKPRK